MDECETLNVPLNEKIIFKESQEKKISKKKRNKILVDLVKNGSCLTLNSNVVDKFGTLLTDITHDDSKLEELVTSEKTFNTTLHQNIGCLVSTVLKNNTHPPKSSQKVRNWFKNPKIIGDPSYFGYAVGVSFTPKSDLFVIKTVQNQKKDTLIHEAAAGLFVTNLVRQYVPNFMYVYDYTECSSLVVDEKKQIRSWCTFYEPESSYLITENVKKSKSLNDWAIDPNTTADELIIIFYQIFNALYVADALSNFQHNDLHSRNVLIRDFGKGKHLAIPIYKKSKDGIKVKGHILTRYVPYIIDYGHCSFTIGENRFTGSTLNHTPIYDLIMITNELTLDLTSSKKFYLEGKIDFVRSLFDKLENFYDEAISKEEKISIENFLNFSKKIFKPFLLTKKTLKEHQDAGMDISFPMKFDKINNCDFYNKVSSPSEIINTTEYSNKVQSLKKDSDELREMLDFDLKPFLKIERELIKSFEERCRKIIKDGKLLLNTFPKKLSKRIEDLFELRDLIFEGASIIVSGLTSIILQCDENKEKKKYYEKDSYFLSEMTEIFNDQLLKIYYERTSVIINFQKSLSLTNLM